MWPLMKYAFFASLDEINGIFMTKIGFTILSVTDFFTQNEIIHALTKIFFAI